MSAFDLEEERLKAEIQRRNARLVLIQLPEGLKLHAPHLASIVQEAGATAIISADPCYGACDLALQEAQNLGVDLLIHYGHSEPPSWEGPGFPVVFIEARSRVSVAEAVEASLPLLKGYSVVGLITTVQHVHKLDEVRSLLLRAGRAVMVGDAGRMKYAGQVIGCDYSNAKVIAGDVDAFLFVGGGRFHALGAYLATGKPVIVADPYERRAYSIVEEAERLIRRRWACVCEAAEAQTFGVLIGLKSGQQRRGEAIRLKDLLESRGRTAILLALREITPKALMQFPSIEAYINTACPRVSIDDTGFLRPVLTPEEALVALGLKSWEDLCAGGWFQS